MLFNTFQFVLFLGCVLLLHRALPPRHRVPLLLAASLLFYTLWIPSYLALLLIDIGVNYALLHWMARGTRPKLALAISVSFTLLLLAYFKYAAMIVTSLAPVLESGLVESIEVPEILLPLGISFYSFQIVAFAVDRFRRAKGPLPSLAHYALFISFFPQLIAGPILRGDQFLPQLAQGGTPDASRNRRGLWLIASGIAKKVIVADFLLAPTVDTVFNAPGIASAPFHWVAMYGFAFQIYFDFSGYTDMGRGMALLLGFELPFNFKEPFLARNPTEVWRRWHMTLSQWLRDYLYISLGGNRLGPTRTQVNLILTMLLGGLWHGAGWNFVVWGGVHGILLALHRRFGRRDGLDEDVVLADAWRIALQFTSFAFVFIFFRSSSIPDALDFITALFVGGEVTGWPVMPCCILILCALSHGAERWIRPRIGSIQARCAESWSGLVIEGLAFGVLLGVAVMVAGAGGEFIYFQF